MTWTDGRGKRMCEKLIAKDRPHIGKDAVVVGDTEDIAVVGDGSVVVKDMSILDVHGLAIGKNAKSDSKSIAVGKDAEAVGSAIAVGAGAKAKGSKKCPVCGMENGCIVAEWKKAESLKQ